MRKFSLLVILVFITTYSFSQQNQRFSTFKSVKKSTSINNLKSGTKSVVDSLYYDGDSENSIGTGEASDFGVYVFFPN